MARRTEVEEWTAEQVAEWLRGKGFDEPARKFEANGVDGTALFRLERNDLKDEIGIEKIGDRKAVWEEIRHLVSEAGDSMKNAVFDPIFSSSTVEALEQVVSDVAGYRSSIENGIDDVAKEIEKSKERHAAMVENVEKHFAKLREAMEQRKAAAIRQLDGILDYKVTVLSKQLEQLKEHDAALQESINDVHSRLAATEGQIDRETLEALRTRLSSEREMVVPIVPKVDSFINCCMEKQLPGDLAAVACFGHIEPHPQALGEVFNYSYDFDTNGILHYLGRALGKETVYMNPGAPEPDGRGLIEVTASSVEYGAPYDAIVHPSVGRGETFLSQDQPGAWVCLNFGPTLSICPTRYTLRNSAVVPGHSLARWALEGSNDGHVYDVLTEHDECGGLLSPERGSTGTFDVLPRCTTFYNRLRIRLTGPNFCVTPNARFHYLMLSGVELYGVLKATL